MRVLVSGAGIGGCTVSHWLAKRGYEVTVIEREAEIRGQGYSLNVIGQSLEVLRRMGLLDQVVAGLRSIRYSNIMDMRGRPLRKDDISEFNSPSGIGIYVERSVLHRALLDALADVELRWSTSLAAIHGHRDGCDVEFHNGRTERYDIVIAADGVRSQTRQMQFGPHGLRETSVAFAVLRTENRYNLPQEAFNLYGPGAFCGLTGLSPEHIGALFFWHEEGGVPPPSERLDALRARYSDFGFRVADVLADLPSNTPIFSDRMGLVDLPVWHKDRVVLLGDAAYCTSPISTQGASLAMIGAYVLADELTKASTPHAAMEAYERRMRPGIDRIQENARRQIQWLLPRTARSAGLRALLLKLMPGSWMKHMMQQQFTRPVVSTL
ncbi:FAD-dependent monooxygenase [Sorangium sp. So ce1000]|uniref:FAD-dependent monooxygenase n=1 Tax=Sorangium sp. So ce1000 TaxID=3133325 RepID=UPI003F6059E9